MRVITIIDNAETENNKIVEILSMVLISEKESFEYGGLKIAIKETGMATVIEISEV
jgi:hypothetical protein